MKIIILSLISGLSTVLGSLVLFINRKYKDKLLSFCFGLASSVMFLVSIFELIPESINYAFNSFSMPILFLVSLGLLMSGGGVVYLLDKYSRSDNELYNIGFLCMLSILVHNIPEGIITSLSLLSNYDFGLKMLFIIMIHNIPEGISIAAPIYYSGQSKIKSLLFSFISGGGEVLGAILGLTIFRFFNIDLLMYFLLMITAGIMVYLSIGKLFIKGIKLTEDNYFILGIFIGIIILVITL